ncbi:hypothetical protein [Paenibacillus eucommiae]|uniref:Uncharacterized protein n=1 Tax=Paenibacillus eucommiae TaxID=1355755 RepID=A0ABS4ISL6_9BACL|nr:hypothetical protein [Paenibacillus eucommiae]MBP1990558.1 hypothetical protein [Paenibacillus eucommiae]
MVELAHVSTLIPFHSGLQVCVSDSRPIQVLQWQCQGEPTADLVRGVYTTNPLHIDKAADFIRLAKETCAELVLTPEYSFPCEVLDMIIGDTKLWPDKGSLWCLGMQGYERQEFAGKLELWTSSGRTLVVRGAFERLKQRLFIDTLIYLFVLDDGRLCILPQFKTIPMSDKWNEYEGKGLCTSDLIYVFDLCGRSEDQNRFLSILCSDALGVQAQEVLDFTQGKHLTIFHAQLNQEPRHDDFRAFRGCLLDRYAGRDIRILTLNWAAGTTIEHLHFSKPWSAFYKKTARRELPEQRHRTSNHAKGTYFALHKFTEIWYSHREEHCKRFDINKGFQIGASYAATTHPEPITQDYFVFDTEQQSWNSAPSGIHGPHEPHEPSGPHGAREPNGNAEPSGYSMKAFIESHGQDYDYPLHAAPHDCDAFFGLCFGHFLEGELSAADDELVSRMLFGSDEESDQKRNEKALQYKTLIKLIKKQDFPLEMQELTDNHELYLDSQTAEDKLKYGNVYPKNLSPEQRNPFQSALFMISEHKSREQVAQQVDELSRKLHLNFRNRVVVYYFSAESNKYERFDEHLQQKRIDKATYSKSLSSIKG